jgi:putative SOS response-associated peptidase YedK
VCGRFALFASPELVAEYFTLAEPPPLAPHYNLTPGQDIAAVRVDRGGARRLGALRWGLVPFWAKDPSIGRRLINARLDSLAEKPAFREALVRRRCLIPASGFYEWGIDAAGKKQPFFVRPRTEPLLALAALWERWRTQAGETLETCVIVTTEASATLAAIHDRMPVMLARAAQDTWLDPRSDIATLAELAARGPEVAAWPVGSAVNDPRNDDERVIAPKTASP